MVQLPLILRYENFFGGEGSLDYFAFFFLFPMHHMSLELVEHAHLERGLSYAFSHSLF